MKQTEEKSNKTNSKIQNKIIKILQIKSNILKQNILNVDHCKNLWSTEGNSELISLLFEFIILRIET